MIAIENINELPHWIKESEFIQSQEKDEVIYFPEEYLIPNILTNENIETVIRAILFFDNVPDNILEYILKQDNDKLKSLVDSFTDFEKDLVEIFVTINSSKKYYLDETLASLGNIYFLDIYLEQYKYFNSTRLVKIAIKNKQSECLQYLIDKGLKADYSNIRMSILNNDLECTKILFNYGLKIDNCLIYQYIRTISKDNFNIELFKLMYNNMSEPFKLNIVNELAKSNIIEGIKYIKEKIDNLDLKDAIAISIINDYFELFKYLIDNSQIVNSFVLNDFTIMTTKYNRLEYLKYLHNNGYQFSMVLTIVAARNGSLECLKYALENGCVYQNASLEISIRNNQSELVKYLQNYLEIN